MAQAIETKTGSDKVSLVVLIIKPNAIGRHREIGEGKGSRMLGAELGPTRMPAR